MRIEDVDKNFVVESNIDKPDIVWLSPKEAPFSIHGLWNPTADARCYTRMPEDTANTVNPGVACLNYHTAGGRIRFKTNSPYIALKAVMPATGTMPHIAKTGQSGFDLYRRADGKTKYYNTFKPQGGVTSGFESVVPTEEGLYTYTINMPLYDGVNEVYIGLAKDAELLPADPYTYEKPVLYYGSSITQGGCASRPGTSYEALISQKYDTDYINLGFSGSASGEQSICEYLATLDVSIFVCDYDHNAPDPAHLEATHEPFYRTYRAKRPDTPIIFVSRTDPYFPDLEKNKEIIRNTYEKALAEGDKNVYFLDGSTFFDCEFGDNCTVDRVHPTDFGFMRMAVCIGEMVGKLLEKYR
ncbi:MAG: SGNH/GDSL hydrolase family protein [Clostridia bacterium]|nr:SGNH/GDSL hydrolase family protein [Clostridia bacterium]